MAHPLSRVTVVLVALLLAIFPLAQAIGAQTLPQVTITATDSFAAEAGLNTGTFTVSRTGDTLAALTVTYSVGGSALAGSDYTALSGTVVIPAGSSVGVITLASLDDLLIETAESVVVTLVASPTYIVGSPLTAIIKIRDNDRVRNVGEDDDDRDEGRARPGWGWGARNHEHFGPPGHGCRADHSCIRHESIASMARAHHDVSADRVDDSGRGHGRGDQGKKRGRGHH